VKTSDVILMLSIAPGVTIDPLLPVRPVEKGLVCNRKGHVCKDPTVEINSIRLVF
jgi:hypothetical protein